MSDVWTNNAQKALSQAARNILENNFCGVKFQEVLNVFGTWNMSSVLMFCIRDISRLSVVDASWSNILKFTLISFLGELSFKWMYDYLCSHKNIICKLHSIVNDQVVEHA